MKFNFNFYFTCALREASMQSAVVLLKCDENPDVLRRIQQLGNGV